MQCNVGSTPTITYTSQAQIPKDRIETSKLSSMLKESDNLRETTKLLPAISWQKKVTKLYTLDSKTLD
jgi:hypothetical protein